MQRHWKLKPSNRRRSLSSRADPASSSAELRHSEDRPSVAAAVVASSNYHASVECIGCIDIQSNQLSAVCKELEAARIESGIMCELHCQ